jgi:hypothetical protein
MFEVAGLDVERNQLFTLLFEAMCPEPQEDDILAHAEWLTERWKRWKIYKATHYASLEDRRSRPDRRQN